jgi:hypothetical protein
LQILDAFAEVSQTEQLRVLRKERHVSADASGRPGSAREELAEAGLLRRLRCLSGSCQRRDCKERHCKCNSDLRPHDSPIPPGGATDDAAHAEATVAPIPGPVNLRHRVVQRISLLVSVHRIRSAPWNASHEGRTDRVRPTLPPSPVQTKTNSPSSGPGDRGTHRVDAEPHRIRLTGQRGRP